MPPQICLACSQLKGAPCNGMARTTMSNWKHSFPTQACSSIAHLGSGFDVSTPFQQEADKGASRVACSQMQRARPVLWICNNVQATYSRGCRSFRWRWSYIQGPCGCPTITFIQFESWCDVAHTETKRQSRAPQQTAQSHQMSKCRGDLSCTRRAYRSLHGSFDARAAI